jgi:hypothetical protein
MTRDQQIQKALALLAPEPAQREECKREIQMSLDRVNRLALMARSSRAAASKRKGGLKRYDAAFRRLCGAYKSLDPTIKPWFSALDFNSATGRAIKAEIEKVKVFLEKEAAPRPDASRNKAAVAAAYALLAWQQQKASVTRGGKWDELAKALAGVQNGDFYDHLRKFKRSARIKIDKKRLPNGEIIYLGAQRPKSL